MVRLFKLYATGDFSLGEIADAAFDLGLKGRTGNPWSKERVRRTLQNPFYIGKVRYKGEVFDGNHEAILEMKTWRRVQRAMEQRGKYVGEKGSKFFLLRGMLVCGTCGNRWTAQDRNGYQYYRCMPRQGGGQCSERYIRVDKLDARIEELLPKIVIEQQTKEEMVDELDALKCEHETACEREEDQLRQELDEKLTNLTDGYASGRIPPKQYDALRAKYQRARLSNETRLDELTADWSKDIALVESILETAVHVDVFYKLATSREERKDLLRAIFKWIEVADRSIQKIEYKPPFHLLLDETAQGDSSESVSGSLLRHLRSAGN